MGAFWAWQKKMKEMTKSTIVKDFILGMMDH